MFDADMIDIGVEGFPDLFIEELSEVGAVVAEQRCNVLECDILGVVMVDVMENIIQNISY